MAVEPTIGIDLGTTNSVVAACDAGGEPRVLPDEHDDKIHPSVVSFHPNGNVIVGAVAKQRRVIDPNNTVYSVKRLIGRPYSSPEVQAALARMPFAILEGANQQPVIRTRGGQFAIPEISAIVLDHVHALARRALRVDVNRAVITVPANFNEGQRSATATAGAIAGLQVEQIINEPTAAALAYGHRRQLDRMIAVYDFGGGTFDISILKLESNVYEVLATAGNSFLGGDDIDETLVDHMRDVFLRREGVDLGTDDLAMQRLRAVAEQIKIQLSRRTRAVVKIDEIAFGPGGRGLDLQLEISREELIGRCAHVVDQTFPVCDEALTLAQVDRRRITDVVLVGGTTKMPYIRERATRYFGTQPRDDVNPDEAVALGAALQANILAKRSAGMAFHPRSGTASHREITHVDGGGGDQRVAEMIARTEQRRRSTSRSIVVGEDGESTQTDALYLSLEPSEITDAEDVEPPLSPRDTLRGVGRDAPGRSTHHGMPPIPRPLPGPLPGPDSADTIDQSFDDASTEGRTASPGARTLFEPPAPAIQVPRTPPPRPSRSPMPGDSGDSSATLPRAPRPSPPPSPTPAPPPPSAPPPPRSGNRPGADTRSETVPRAANPVAPAAFQTGRSPIAPLDADLGGLDIDPSEPIAQLSPPVAPTIHEITPHTLGIGTVAGFCEPLIARNTQIPHQTSKSFSTSKDGQRTVRIVVVLGESRRLGENVRLGDLVLDNLPPRPRGETTIEVTFAINASGMLDVSAVDLATGQHQRASVELLGAQSSDEIAASQHRMRQLLG